MHARTGSISRGAAQLARAVTAAALGLASCAGAAATPPPAESAAPPRFGERVAPLASERCDRCHAEAPGGSMAVYRTARRFITPGKPDESPYCALPKGHPRAWGDAEGVVRAWIEAGASE